jgi:cell filamentation protein
VPGRFDTAQLKPIHKHIFRDVYAWAGQFRTVNISKGGHPFGAAALVEPALNDLLQKLSAENYRQIVDSKVFASRAGFCLGEINAAHLSEKETAALKENSSEGWGVTPALWLIGAA